MPLDPSQVHMDMRILITGAYHGGLNRTTFHTPLPFYGNRVVRLLTGTMGPLETNDGTITLITVANPTRVTSVGHGLVTGQTVTIAGSNSTPSINGNRVVTVVTGTITANSMANPTVVTSNGHGLVTGQTLTIVGSNSTPSIDGGHIVTVINSNTFSIPVNVTVAGTAGTWTSHDQFTVPVNVTVQGTAGTWISADHTGFQVEGNFGTGGDCVMGTLFDTEVELSEVVPRDEQDRPELETKALLQRVILLHKTRTAFDVMVEDIDASLRANQQFTWAASLIATPDRTYNRFRVPLGRIAEACTISIRESTYKPFLIHGLEYHLEIMDGAR